MRNTHFLLMEEGGVGGRERKKERERRGKRSETEMFLALFLHIEAMWIITCATIGDIQSLTL